MSRVSCWRLVAVCCRVKQRLGHKWQHVTGLGREHLCSASKYLLCHGHRDNLGELVQEPTGKNKKLGCTYSSVLTELDRGSITLGSRMFSFRTDCQDCCNLLHPLLKSRHSCPSS